MHEVAGFYMLSCAGDYPEIIDGEPEDWVDHGEIEIGRGVLTRLGVPDGVFQAIEAMWAGLRAIPPETLGDTLLLANDLSPVPSPLYQPRANISEQGARTIDFLIGDGSLHGIMLESAEEVRSLYSVLMM